MQLETKKHLEDIRLAAEAIVSFTEGEDLDSYRQDLKL